mmetsp:Transcript_10390/g.34174  ORF Transcript_10390/g.34174 Transcript_10390/m.34174 type:complete len:271 (-) Transcript_10390:4995-5807(-)
MLCVLWLLLLLLLRWRRLGERLELAVRRRGVLLRREEGVVVRLLLRRWWRRRLARVRGRGRRGRSWARPLPLRCGFSRIDRSSSRIDRGRQSSRGWSRGGWDGRRRLVHWRRWLGRCRYRCRCGRWRRRQGRGGMGESDRGCGARSIRGRLRRERRSIVRCEAHGWRCCRRRRRRRAGGSWRAVVRGDCEANRGHARRSCLSHRRRGRRWRCGQRRWRRQLGSHRCDARRRCHHALLLRGAAAAGTRVFALAQRFGAFLHGELRDFPLDR